MFVNKLIKPLLLSFFIGSIVLIFSCNKDKNSYVSYTRGVESSKQFVSAQQMMTQLMSTYFKSLNDSILFADKKANIDGATVYLWLDETPKRLRIEYPSWFIADGYGHWRQGVYEAYSDNGYQQVDEVVRFKFMDFLWDQDSLRVDSLVVFNHGKTDGKNYRYNIDARQIDLIYRDTAGVLSFGMHQTFTVFKDAATIYTSLNDSLGIFGSLKGTTKLDWGFDVQCTADSAMLFSYSCNWLKNGVVQIETQGFNYSSTVYFAVADTCENRYLIEIDNNPFPFPFD